MVHGTFTYWRMTINNYDATDLALVRQGYPDDIRQLIYTLEEGENGTPHVQAYIHMKRSVRMAHMKKLFPRGNFGAMDDAAWRLNQKNYAQKLDETARSPAVITNYEPLHTIESVLKAILNKMVIEESINGDLDWRFMLKLRNEFERNMVQKDYKLAKVFVSATYKAMWREYGPDMYAGMWKKYLADLEARKSEHTHTHTRLEENVAEVNIPTIDEDACTHGSGDSTEQDGEEQGEDYTDSFGSEDEADAESECFESGEEDDGA